MRKRDGDYFILVVLDGGDTPSDAAGRQEAKVAGDARFASGPGETPSTGPSTTSIGSRQEAKLSQQESASAPPSSSQSTSKRRIVGTGALVVERKFIHNLGMVGHIEDIAVAKDQQGKKLGLRIIQALDHVAKEVGCYKVSILFGSSFPAPLGTWRGRRPHHPYPATTILFNPMYVGSLVMDDPVNMPRKPRTRRRSSPKHPSWWGDRPTGIDENLVNKPRARKTPPDLAEDEIASPSKRARRSSGPLQPLDPNSLRHSLQAPGTNTRVLSPKVSIPELAEDSLLRLNRTKRNLEVHLADQVTERKCCDHE